MKQISATSVQKIGNFVRRDKDGLNPVLTVDIVKLAASGVQFAFGRKIEKDTAIVADTSKIDVDYAEKNGETLFVHLPFGSYEREENDTLDDLRKYLELAIASAQANGWKDEQILGKLWTNVRLLENESAWDEFTVKAKRATVNVADALAKLGEALVWAATGSPEAFAEYSKMVAAKDPTAATWLVAQFLAK